MLETKNNIKQARVFIVTAVYNSIQHTRLMMSSIEKQTYKNITTIVVDDGSKDGTGMFIKKKYPNVVLLHGNGNLWWTEGINTGIRKALKYANKNDYIVTINNDCTFLKDYIFKLVKAANKNRNSIVGSFVKDFKNRTKTISGYISTNWKKGTISSIDNEPNGQRRVDVLVTRGTIFPVEAIKNVGFLNSKKFPHYASDIEYTIRMKEHGWKLTIDSNCVVYSDRERTGLNFKSYKKYNISRILKLMFSRKSAVNIIDQYNLIKYVVPKKYKNTNYTILIKKIIYMFTLPFRK